MRSLVLVGIGAASAASVFACTALLGDFTIGKGTDGGGGDSPYTAEGGGGEGGTDAPVDAPPPLKPLNCVLTAPKVSFNWTKVCAGQTKCANANVDNGDRVYVYPLAQKGRFRILIMANASLYYADFSDNDSDVALNEFPLSGGTGGYVQSMTRYPAGAQTGASTGTVFTTVFYATGGKTGIGSVLFPDSASVPVVGINLIDPASGQLPSGLNNLQTSMEVIDALSGEYLVAIEYIDSSSIDYLFGLHTKGAPGIATKITSGSNPAGGSQYSIAHDSSHAYLLWNPPSASGPPNGPMPLYTLDLVTMGPIGSARLLGPDSGFYQPFAFIGSPTSPGMTDLAFIQADLNQQTLSPVMHVGQVKMTDLATFDPAPIVGPALTLDQLTFNKGSAQWSAYPTPTGDHFLTVSRPINDGTPGMNFLWVDTLGRMRSSMSETDGAAGWPGNVINTAAVTLVDTPALGFATVRIAWTEGQAKPNNSPAVYSMAGTCLAN